MASHERQIRDITVNGLRIITAKELEVLKEYAQERKLKGRYLRKTNFYHLIIKKRLIETGRD